MKVVSLCTGYGGLELALAAAGIEHQLAYLADPDPAAAKVLDERFPGVPNLGDITTVDWAALDEIEGIAAGYPCQGFSLAGQRKGADDERFIWPAIADAVRILRPRFVLLENVAGHRSLGFGRVLGDLAALGYDACWVSVRASDVGAAHRRERVFILAHPAGQAGLLPTPRASANENRQGKRTPTQEAGAHGRSLAAEVCTLFPTPDATHGRKTSRTSLLLPTPTATPYGHQKSPSPGAAVRPSLDTLARLLPSPTVADSRGSRNATASRNNPLPTTATTGWTLSDVAHADRWGEYGPAVAKWEAFLGRPAPEPTEPGRDGKPRLAARFTEWLMGLPGGWVCDVPGLSRNEQLRLLGNGVVYQQAAYALHLLAGAR